MYKGFDENNRINSIKICGPIFIATAVYAYFNIENFMSEEKINALYDRQAMGLDILIYSPGTIFIIFYSFILINSLFIRFDLKTSILLLVTLLYLFIVQNRSTIIYFILICCYIISYKPKSITIKKSHSKLKYGVVLFLITVVTIFNEGILYLIQETYNDIFIEIN